jgi:hypothetical protein
MDVDEALDMLFQDATNGDQATAIVLTEMDRLRARVAELEAMEQRAQTEFAAADDPSAVEAIGYILHGGSR